MPPQDFPVMAVRCSSPPVSSSSPPGVPTAAAAPLRHIQRRLVVCELFHCEGPFLPRPPALLRPKGCVGGPDVWSLALFSHFRKMVGKEIMIVIQLGLAVLLQLIPQAVTIVARIIKL